MKQKSRRPLAPKSSATSLLEDRHAEVLAYARQQLRAMVPKAIARLVESEKSGIRPLSRDAKAILAKLRADGVIPPREKGCR